LICLIFMMMFIPPSRTKKVSFRLISCWNHGPPLDSLHTGRGSNLRHLRESVNIADPVTKMEIMEILEEIKSQIDSNTILLYMKGSPDQPQCGFSAQASQVLMACGEKFAFIDILANPEIRANLPQISEWPTFPQLFIGGELVGGCDIINEMYQSGELEPMIKEAAPVED
jgi:monothiol glutaredoxin